MRWAKRVLLVLLAVLVTGFLLLRVPDTDPAAMRGKYGAAPSQFVTLPDGPTVHYRDEGPRDAPVLVLLHGSNADLHTWQPWVDRLKDRYRIIRYDQRGHGLTGPAPDENYGRGAFGRDLDALTAKLKIGRFALAGNSMGGGIAARYAMTHPDRLTALVLVDSVGAPVARKGGGNLAFAIARIPGLSRLAMQVMPRAMIEKSLSQSVSNQAVVTPAAVDRYWELARYPGNRAATLARFAEPMQPFPTAEVAAIRVPTLVMWGREDGLLPFAGAEWFARTIPGAQLVAYDRTGHLPMEEMPDRSAADVAAFLEGTTTPPARSAGK